MTPDALFRIAGMLAALGWLCLLTTPLWPRSVRNTLPRQVGAMASPALIAALYTGLILTHWVGHRGGFNTLADVMLLFTDPWLVLAGWVHYLAFDLFIGGWSLADSRERKVPHLAMMPVLLLTFFFGPIGLLAYLAMRLFFQPKAAVPTL
jgi:hypothetical protein